MISSFRLLLAGVFLTFSMAAGAQMPAMVDGEPVPSLAPLVERVTPAVVNIRVSQTVQQRNPFADDPFWQFFGGPNVPNGSRQVASAGSGVIVDARNGYVITNAHVIENADEITVTLQDDRTFSAEVVGTDPASDIAVIKIEPDDLTDIPLSDSEQARVGDDGEHLLEVVQHLQCRHSEAGGNRDHDPHAIRVLRGEHRAHEPADRAADHGVERLDAEIVQQPDLRIDDVGERQGRKRRPVRGAGRRVDRGRPGRPVAAAQVVDAQHGVPVGVDSPSRTDVALPPSGVQLLGPQLADFRDGVERPRQSLLGSQAVDCGTNRRPWHSHNHYW